MIAEICFTADWLEKKRKELKGIAPSLLERALHAFALLGHLAESDLKFVFKGGTSLLLHVPVIRRLSIDIDILCSAPATELDGILENVAKIAPFVRYEKDERGDRNWGTGTFLKRRSPPYPTGFLIVLLRNYRKGNRTLSVCDLVNDGIMLA